jgi:hypothetical protein
MGLFNGFSIMAIISHFRGMSHVAVVIIVCCVAFLSYLHPSMLTTFDLLTAMTTDPGSVPHSATPLPDDESENDYEAGQR